MRLDVFSIDCETTGLDPETDSLLEVALYAREDFMCFDHLVHFEGPIPAASKAVHHIQERDVNGLGGYAFLREDLPMKLNDQIAHSKPEERILVAHHAEFDRAFLPELQEETWICTERIAKHLLPGLESYGLQYLRYFLELDIDPPGKPHRAMYDAVCCYEVFLKLYAISVDQNLDVFASRSRLEEWCWSPIMLLRMPLGKHKGETFEWVRDNDVSYLHWMMKTARQ